MTAIGLWFIHVHWIFFILHSNLLIITPVTIQVHVILGRYVVVAWTWIIENHYIMYIHYGITTQSRHRINDDKDNEEDVMHASAWFEFLGGLF